ncbi:hypothetical protein ACHAXR_005127 [Thalassiosira sp. AJA248-18]
MCQWCHQLTDICKLSRHAVSRSMDYLDRFIASSSSSSTTTNSPRAQQHALLLTDKREYQLAAMTCLYISIKLHEPLAMNVSLLAEISAGCYTPQEILDMESCILQSLGWRVNGPTCQEFLSLYLSMLHPEEYGYELNTLASLLDVGTFQLELAVGDYDLSLKCKPSLVALAALLNSLEGLDEELLPGELQYDYLTRLCELLLFNNDNNSDGNGDGCGEGSVEVIMDQVSHIQAHLRGLFCRNSGVLGDDHDDNDSRMMTDNCSSQDPPSSNDANNSTIVKKNRHRHQQQQHQKCVSSPVSVVRCSPPSSSHHRRFAKCA